MITTAPLKGSEIRSIFLGTRVIEHENTRQWAKLAPGNLIWVRENARGLGVDRAGRYRLLYEADYKAEGRFCWQPDEPNPYEKLRMSARPWVSSLHMPKWASRITLEVTSVDRTSDGSRVIVGFIPHHENVRVLGNATAKEVGMKAI